MASEEAIKKMIQAIMERRKDLGMLDWGIQPIEEVLDKLNQDKEKQENKSEKQDGLESEEI